MPDIRPPIPATCESRPTIGGLVIPWINVQLADGGVDFRSQHSSRAQRCLLESLCQVCGTVIAGPPYVLIGGPGQLSRLQFDEPPLHPECRMVGPRTTGTPCTPPVTPSAPPQEAARTRQSSRLIRSALFATSPHPAAAAPGNGSHSTKGLNCG